MSTILNTHTLVSTAREIAQEIEDKKPLTKIEAELLRGVALRLEEKSAELDATKARILELERPAEPSEDAVIAGFECAAFENLVSAVCDRRGWPYTCAEAAECVRGIYKAMITKDGKTA